MHVNVAHQQAKEIPVETFEVKDDRPKTAMEKEASLSVNLSLGNAYGSALFNIFFLTHWDRQTSFSHTRTNLVHANPADNLASSPSGASAHSSVGSNSHILLVLFA